MKKKFLVAGVLSIFLFGSVAEANSVVYKLQGIEVLGERVYNRFGNEVTKQSYVRTGGDVQVIQREDIEKHHDENLSDALKRVPGVWIRSPGYRGGAYGFESTHSTVSINGDEHVAVLVNGRRMNNNVSRMISGNIGQGSRASIDINQVIDLQNVESIEVMKGGSSSIYGADATGGVINIITREGGEKLTGSLRIANGTGGKTEKALYVSGKTHSNLRFALSGTVSGQISSWYKDGDNGKIYQHVGTDYEENNFYSRIDLDLAKNQTLTFSYDHMALDAGWPYTVPWRKFLNEKDWKRVLDKYFNEFGIGDDNPGYRNLFYVWAATGAYTAYNLNHSDVTYTFSRDRDLESYIRLYRQNGHYKGSWGNGDDPDTPLPGSKEWNDWVKKNYQGRDYAVFLNKENTKGMQFQFGKVYGNHRLLTRWEWNEAYTYKWNRKAKVYTGISRRVLQGAVQDKIDLTDKLQLTPSLRYIKPENIKIYDVKGNVSELNTEKRALTGAVAAQYLVNDSTLVYGSINQVYVPVKPDDYVAKNEIEGKTVPAGLKDEKGVMWNLGIKKGIGDRTQIGINYGLTKMSNAVASYLFWSREKKEFIERSVNAREDKTSLNVTLHHRIGNNWLVGLSYAYFNDVWEAQKGSETNSELSGKDGNVNVAINRLRPKNVYTANISYVNDKFNFDVFGSYYTGMKTTAFTKPAFFVADVNINYNITNNYSVYLNITNITNAAWESIYDDMVGIGAFAQPSRAFMVGMNYKY